MNLYIDKDGQHHLTAICDGDHRKTIQTFDYVAEEDEALPHARHHRDLRVKDLRKTGWAKLRIGILRHVRGGPLVGYYVQAWKYESAYQREIARKRKR